VAGEAVGQGVTPLGVPPDAEPGSGGDLTPLLQQKQEAPQATASETEQEKGGGHSRGKGEVLHGWRGSRAAPELLLVHTLDIFHLCSLLSRVGRTTFIQKQLVCHCTVW